ncbi:pyridoxamine 5'-phosphate oxidase family protein [Agromyces soli]
MSDATEFDPTGAARAVVDASTYLTLATADASGRPWSTPVWFAERELREFSWVSRTTTRHSRNIAARRAVALSIFDSRVAVGEAVAVYVAAEASTCEGDELDATLAVFNAKSAAQGLPAWGAERVTGEAPHRLYRATALDVWVLDASERRVRIGPESLPPVE